MWPVPIGSPQALQTLREALESCPEILGAPWSRLGLFATVQGSIPERPGEHTLARARAVTRL
eukprot:4424724-Alexandrium_andersonii.AAC.1